MKYGREDKVQQLLEQYRNFVSRNRIFQEFNKAYIDMQKVVEEYKKEGNVGKLVNCYEDDVSIRIRISAELVILII